MTQASSADQPSDSGCDDLLDRFEQAWRQGTPPCIDEFLAPVRLKHLALTAAARRQLVIELIKIDLGHRWRCKPTGCKPWALEDYGVRYPELGPPERLPVGLIGEEYWARHRWGDRPAHDEYVQRFPHAATQLRDALTRIDSELAVEFARSKQPAPNLAVPSSHAGSGPPSVATLLEALRLLLGPAQLSEIGAQPAFSDARALARSLLARNWLTPYQVNQLLQGRGRELLLEPYLLLERLGEGGAGQVFKARHRTLQRVVALKLIRKELLADAEVVGRFQRERRILSQLDHPNIVRAYDAGPGGASFLAMEYVEGIDLGRLVKQNGPMPVMQACEYIRQAACGLAHAHEKGLVHRDIKPHNLIMSVRDGLIKVADLGLARLPRTLNSEASAMLGGANTTGTLTPEHAVLMGTADYLAPEQALNFHDADIRADIYSLGCTFYYLLTAQPPYAGGGLAQKVAKHLQAEPPRVEERRPDVPRPLAAVIRKMLAKRPEDRFQSPVEVAQALTPWAGSDSRSAIVPQKGRFARWGRMLPRRRAALAVGGLVFLGLLILALRSRGLATRTGADKTAGAELPRLERSFPVKKQDYLHTVAFSANGRWAASGGGDKTITLWATASGTEEFTLTGHTGPISHLAFSPDGRWLASGSGDGLAWKLWDLAARREAASFTIDARIHPTEALVGPFSPDGKYLAVRTAKETVSLVDVASKQNVAAFPKLEASAMAFSADSRTFVFAIAGTGAAIVHEPLTRRDKRFTLATSYIFALAFAPDRNVLAITTWNGDISLLDAAPLTLDAATLKLDQPVLKSRMLCKGHADAVVALAFAPDGKTLASAGLDKTVRLWDPATGKEMLRLGQQQGYTKPIRAVAFSPDGKTLYTGSDDDVVRVWRVRD